MPNTIIHCCISVRGMLKTASRKQLAAMFRDPQTGARLTADQAKDQLLDQLAAGREVLPLGPPCDGFDYAGGGCPGHDHEEESNA